jgi:hypothetical protein
VAALAGLVPVPDVREPAALRPPPRRALQISFSFRSRGHLELVDAAHLTYTTIPHQRPEEYGKKPLLGSDIVLPSRDFSYLSRTHGTPEVIIPPNPEIENGPVCTATYGPIDIRPHSSVNLPGIHVLHTGKPYLDDHGKPYQADEIYTGTDNGKPVKRCVQIKAIKSLGKLGANMREEAEQLNGRKDGSDENCPPGFERVLVIELENSVGPGMAYGGIRPALEEFLKAKKNQQARQNLCGSDRTRFVDRLVIVNAAGTHEWTDLDKTLGIPC